MFADVEDDDDNELSFANTAFAGAVNNLGHLCDDIDKTINQKVQDNLNKLKDDCDECIKRIESLLADDKEVSISHCVCTTVRIILLITTHYAYPVFVYPVFTLYFY